MVEMISINRAYFNRLERTKAILDERDRQDDMWGIQDNTPSDWVTILAKQVGDLASAVLDITDPQRDFRKEAIQVAAVALAMVEQYVEGEFTPGWGPTETQPKVFNEGECD